MKADTYFQSNEVNNLQTIYLRKTFIVPPFQYNSI